MWIRIRIQEAPEDGSNTDPDPQHCFEVIMNHANIQLNCTNNEAIDTVQVGIGYRKTYTEIRIRKNGKNVMEL